jgi:AAA+ superfamily predicted ATPase
VAGCDEAKEEVKEIVDYLRDPSRSRAWVAAFRAASCWRLAGYR